MTVLPLICLAILAPGQGTTAKKPQTPDPKKTSAEIQRLLNQKSGGTWAPSKMSAKELAAKVGAAIKNMRGVDGRFQMVYQTNEGRGSHNGYLKVQDSTHYRVDGIMLTSIPVTTAMAGNGTSRLIRRGMKALKPIPISQKLDATSLAPAAYARFFPIDFTRMMFQGLTDRVDGWGPLISSLQKGNEGYTLAVSERRSQFQGRKLVSYKLSGARKGPLVKKLGPASYEFVIDGNRFLPVSVQTVWADEKGKKWIARWSAGYNFGKKFTSSDWSLAY